STPFHSVARWISCVMLRFWNDSSTSLSSGQPSSSTEATQAGSSNRYGASAPARDAALGVGLPGPPSSALRTSAGPEGGRSVCTVMLAISLLDILDAGRGPASHRPPPAPCARCAATAAAPGAC